MLTGTVTLRDPFGKPTVEFDALAENLIVDNKEIGNTTFKRRCKYHHRPCKV